MKKYTVLYIIIIFIFGCNSKSPLGRWIETDNYTDPQILTFYKDSLVIERPYSGSYLYKMKNDTLLVGNTNQIVRSLLKFDNEKLTYSNLDGSYTHVFEKYTNSNICEYFNETFGIDIELVTIDLENELFLYNCNVFFIDTADFYFNGIHLDLDSLQPQQIADEAKPFERIRNVLFVDKSVKYERLSRLYKTIQKSGNTEVIYAVSNKTNALFGQTTYLPSLEFPRLIDRVHYNRLTDANSLVAIEEDAVYLNSRTISQTDFLDSLSRKIQTNDKYLIYIYTSGNVSFEHYLITKNSIRALIDSLRDNYSISKYHKNFNDIEMEMQNDVRKKFPVRIMEIDSVEYNQSTTSCSC